MRGELTKKRGRGNDGLENPQQSNNTNRRGNIWPMKDCAFTQNQPESLFFGGAIMGLFGKSKDSEKERKKIKSKVDKLMNQYDNEKIDGATYSRKMMKLASSQKRK